MRGRGYNWPNKTSKQQNWASIGRASDRPLNWTIRWTKVISVYLMTFLQAQLLAFKYVSETLLEQNGIDKISPSSTVRVFLDIIVRFKV